MLGGSFSLDFSDGKKFCKRQDDTQILVSYNGPVTFYRLIKVLNYRYSIDKL